jgi:DNA-binding FrmR family transcriptional regulator
MTEADHHRSHAGIAKRLKRARGHLDSVIGMMEAGRPCLDLAQQLHAVEKAVMEAKRTLIRDHLDDCLVASSGAANEAERAMLDEMRAITRYL